MEPDLWRNRGDQAFAVFQTSDGGYVLTGVQTLLEQGVLICGSSRQMLREICSGIIPTEEQSAETGTSMLFKMAMEDTQLQGRTASFGAGGNDFWLIKTRCDWKSVWNKTYGGTGTDGQTMVQTI